MQKYTLFMESVSCSSAASITQEIHKKQTAVCVMWYPLISERLFRLSIEKPEEMEVERWDGRESTTLCSPL